MPKGDVHTNWDRDAKKWVNKVEGGQRASNSGPTKEPVEAQGRKMAKERGVEHVVHRKADNTIQRRNTYPRGRDPKESKG